MTELVPTRADALARRRDQVDACIPAPAGVDGVDLDFGFLCDLALKTVYADTSCTTSRAADRLLLPVPLVDTVLQHLYRERYIEIRETLGPQQRRYAILQRGLERVARLLDMSSYIGPAPVSLQAYSAMVRRQEAERPAVTPDRVRAAFSDLVVGDGTLEMLGVVANSRRSLFIAGPPGNGKTSIARALHRALPGEIWIPRAIEVDGHVIKMFDAHTHEPVDTPRSALHDARWVRIRRPLVVMGGELTIESMDLGHDPTVRYYEAPAQLKSNGGTLLIDDFGRQRVAPRDLLNRWIIPLEHRVDYLTLHTGKKIQVPFEQLLIFATNLDVADLGDAAFLRRLGYRLSVASPDFETFTRIFAQHVRTRGLSCDPEVLERVRARYASERHEMRACHPRDLVDRCVDICRFEQREPAVTLAILERAWDYYFGTRAAA